MSSDIVKITEQKQTPLSYFLMLLGFASDGKEMELASSRMAAEVISSLGAAIDQSSLAWFVGFSQYKYIGSVTNGHFKIFCTSRGRNSWRPVLYGNVEELPNGSLLKAHFEIHPLVKVGMLNWMVLIISLAVSFPDPFMKCWFLGMLLIGIAVGKIGSLFGESDKKDLIALLELVAEPSQSLNPTLTNALSEFSAQMPIKGQSGSSPLKRLRIAICVWIAMILFVFISTYMAEAPVRKEFTESIFSTPSDKVSLSPPYLLNHGHVDFTATSSCGPLSLQNDRGFRSVDLNSGVLKDKVEPWMTSCYFQPQDAHLAGISGDIWVYTNEKLSLARVIGDQR